jgi:hypothetical protein
MRNTEKKILEKKITGRANTIILPTTATFKGVHHFACVMLFAKMVDEFRDMGLITKAKKRKKQDEEDRLKFEKLDKKNARATGPLMNREFNRMLYEEKMKPADALEDLTLLLNERFAEIISHDPGTESEAGVDYDEQELITPAMSDWLKSKYDELVKVGEIQKDDIDPAIFTATTESNSHPHWLGMLPSSIRDEPQKSANNLVYEEHPLGAAWHEFLEGATEDGRFELDEKAMQEFYAARAERKRLAEEQQKDSEKGFGEDYKYDAEKEEYVPAREFGTQEEEQQRAKEGYERLFSRQRLRPRGGEREGSDIKPIGKYNDMASTLADMLIDSINKPVTKKIRNRETGEDEDKTYEGGEVQYLYDTYHKDAQIADWNDMQDRHKAEVKGKRKAAREPILRRQEQEISQWNDYQEQLKDRLRYTARNNKFQTMQQEVNEHAREALRVRNIGLVGSKKGRAPNIVTPALKQMAKLLNLDVRGVNAPDVMLEPLKVLMGDTPRRALVSSSYQTELGRELDKWIEGGNKAHPAIETSINPGGHMHTAGLVQPMGDERGGGPGLSMSGDDAGEGYVGEGGGGRFDEAIEEEGGQDVNLAGDDAASPEAATRVDDSSALGSGSTQLDPSDDKMRARAMALIRDKSKGGVFSEEERAKYEGSLWMSHKDELMRKVKRGEMTQERARAELSEAFFDEHDFNPEHGYAIHSMDQIPEVHDPSHPLYGKDANERQMFAERMLDSIMGTFGMIQGINAMQDAKAAGDEEGWAHNDSYRVNNIGDLKNLFTAPAIHEHGDEDRAEEDEAAFAQQQFLGRYLEQSSELMRKFEQLGVDYNDVVNEIVRVVQKRGRRAQGRQAEDEEPLSDDQAFQEAFMNIVTGAGNQQFMAQATEQEQKEIEDQIQQLEENVDSHRQMYEMTGDYTDEHRTARRQLAELKQKLQSARREGGSTSALPFARSIFYAMKNRIDARKEDMDYLNKTRRQTHNLMGGNIATKKDCDACVGSKEHFVNTTKRASHSNSHEKINRARGAQSPFVYMKVNVPDLTHIPREGKSGQANLESMANFLGLDWNILDNYSDYAVKDILYEAMVKNKQDAKNISEHFNLVPRPQNLEPVGAATMNPAQLVLMSRLFPDDYNAFRAREEENDIMTQQRQSITSALNLLHELQTTGFKSRVNMNKLPLSNKDKRKLAQEILVHSGGRKASELKDQMQQLKERRAGLGEEFKEFFANQNNSDLLASYSDARKTIAGKDPNIFPDLRARVEAKMKELGRRVKLPKGTAMSGEDYLKEVFNAYQTHDREMAQAKKLYDDAKKEVKEYDQNGIGALVQMANEIVPFYTKQMKEQEGKPEGDSVPVKNRATKKFIENMMKQYYTEPNGMPSRTVFTAGMKSQRRRGRSLAEAPYSYDDKVQLYAQKLGSEKQWVTGSGATLRHGGDRNFGSIFGAEQGVFSIPHIKNISEIPALLKIMQKNGWEGEVDESPAETERLKRDKEYFEGMGFGKKEAKKEETPEDDDGLMSELDARRRNQSDMSTNADKRNKDNQLGTPSHCGFCRGHGSVPIEKLSSYFSAHHDDLRHLNHYDEEMMHYISQNGRPVNTPSFDHHREQHGENAYHDHEHAAYACPDCQHEDSSVRGGLCSDGLCNHCLGRGEIDPKDKTRMAVLINERLKHDHHFGSHATLEGLSQRLARMPWSHKAFKDMGLDDIINIPTRLDEDTPGSNEMSDKDIQELLARFPARNNDALMPMEMLFDSAMNGEFPNVLSPDQLRSARKRRQAAEEKRGHIRAMKHEKVKREEAADELGYQETAMQESDPMQAAMSFLPSHAVRRTQNGVLRKMLIGHIGGMMQKLQNLNADESVIKHAQEMIDEITEGIEIKAEPNSNFILGGSASFGSDAHFDNRTLNHMFSQLQNLVSKEQRKHHAPLDELASEAAQDRDVIDDDAPPPMGQQEEVNPAKVFNKKHHRFNQPMLYFHKGRMMTQAEIRAYDDHDGFDSHVVSPHKIEKWFARNGDPTQRMDLKAYKKLLKKRSYPFDLYAPHPDDDPLRFGNKPSDILGAFKRQGPTARKAHEYDLMRAEKMKKRIAEMEAEGTKPFMKGRTLLRHNNEFKQLANELGMPVDSDEGFAGKFFEGHQLHDSLQDFHDEAQKWFMPTAPTLDEKGKPIPGSYQEPIENEAPLHTELSDAIDNHLDKEFEQYVRMKAIMHTLNMQREGDAPPQEGEITVAQFRQMNQPGEMGGDVKGMMNLNAKIDAIIEGAKGQDSETGKTIYRFGDEDISKHDYMDMRYEDLQDAGQSEPDMFADGTHKGLADMLDAYFVNYEKNPMIAKDRKLVKFGANMYKAHFYPNMMFESLMKRNDLRTQDDVKRALEEDPEFAQQYAMTFGLIEAQHDNWMGIPINVSEHLDDLSHVGGVMNDKYVPKYGTASHPLSQASPLAPPQKPDLSQEMGQIRVMQPDKVTRDEFGRTIAVEQRDYPVAGEEYGKNPTDPIMRTPIEEQIPPITGQEQGGEQTTPQQMPAMMNPQYPGVEIQPPADDDTPPPMTS